MRSKKHALLHQKRKTGREEDKISLAKFSNFYNAELRKAEKDFNENKIDELKSQPKALWKFYNSVSGLGKDKTASSVNCIKVDDNIITDTSTICDVFNHHYVKVGPTIAREVPKINTKFHDYLPPRNPNTFWISPVTPVDIARTIEGLKNKTSLDLYDHSNWLVKQLAIPLSIPLSYIYNKSYSQGVFPNAFKKIKICPVFKKEGDPLDPNSYRPIAITNVLGKAMEIMFNVQLVSFLNENNVISCTQYGYRTHTSINHAIINFLNHVTDFPKTE